MRCTRGPAEQRRLPKGLQVTRRTAGSPASNFKVTTVTRRKAWRHGSERPSAKLSGHSSVKLAASSISPYSGGERQRRRAIAVNAAVLQTNAETQPEQDRTDVLSARQREQLRQRGQSAEVVSVSGTANSGCLHMCLKAERALAKSGSVWKRHPRRRRLPLIG